MGKSSKSGVETGMGISAKAFAKAVAEHPQDRFVLRLYVSGMTQRSKRAIENLKKLCEEHLAGRYDLQIVDIYQQPDLAKEGQVIAAPTLVKQLPSPLRRVIGDMSDPGRILVVLGIAAATGEKR